MVKEGDTAIRQPLISLCVLMHLCTNRVDYVEYYIKHKLLLCLFNLRSKIRMNKPFSSIESFLPGLLCLHSRAC
jgi:hypothetical protein